MHKERLVVRGLFEVKISTTAFKTKQSYGQSWEAIFVAEVNLTQFQIKSLLSSIKI